MQTDFKEATMFRHACRVAVLAGAVAATLALAGNALANPTRPTISSPTSTSVLAGNLTVRWTPSTFGDPGMIAGLYRLHVSDTTGGTMTSLPDPPAVLAPATSTTITVSADHSYIVCIEALAVVTSGPPLSSITGPGNPADCRAFTAFATPQLLPEIWYLPWQSFKLPDPVCWCWDGHPKFDGVQPDPKTLAAIAGAQGYAGFKLTGATVYPTGEVKVALAG